MPQKNLYISTPLFYPNDKPHLGHLYTAVIADAIARVKTQQGYDVCFVTGLDEHGQKIAQAAARSGQTCQQFVDNQVKCFQQV